MAGLSSLTRATGVGHRLLAPATALLLVVGLPAVASADFPTSDDPRVGLGAGFDDAETAALAMEGVGFFDKQDSPFWDPGSISPNVGAAIATANSDMAFTGNHAIQGNWRGFQVYDVSDPADPSLVVAVLCPGGQGDVTVHGDLLFTSVEESSGRTDCGTQGAGPSNVPNPDRMRGIRIWDISDIANPQQVGLVQTCRGSHTHRLVEDLDDPSVVYIYNSGTSSFRHPDEAGLNCRDPQPSATDPVPAETDTDRWQIEVIRVPVNDPAAAEIVNEVRLFAGEDGRLNGLQNTQPGVPHPCASTAEGCGPVTPTTYSPLPNTNTCHDITVYPEVDLAAGACQGNGLLMDISDPANPVRIDAVADPNFSYWHSANFNNDGTAVMFTDEWGGGTGARCRATDRLEWGANALFNIVDTPQGKRLEFASYFKMPAVQTVHENCVAHQANIVPVPGRDIIVQAWYQGGISMFDWTDPANPFEIGFFDRGPIATPSDPTTGNPQIVLGGFWSGYWYNGNVYGGEIARGMDVLGLTPTDQLSQNEIEAAETVRLDEHNPMSERRITWDPSFPVVRAHRDQLVRADGLTDNERTRVDAAIDRAERFQSGPKKRAAIANLEATANSLRSPDQQALADAMRALVAALR